MVRRSIIALVAWCGLAGMAVAQSYRPDFDPARFKGPQNGPRNRLMVLGSPHLSGLPATFQPADLALLIGRLRDWKPQAIAIEALSGAQCDFLRRHPARYADTVKDYCWDTAPATAATGLDVPAATAEAARLLAAWPAEPSAGQRRQLAAVFLAAGESVSGLVQWLRLPAGERHAGDGLDAALVDRLEALRLWRNESTLIAAPLAASLGLERVYAMDDHTADAPIGDEKAYATAIGRAWDNPATARRKAIDKTLEERRDTPAGVVAMYRAYNAPGVGKLTFDSDFGAALEESSPQKFGRLYLGYWETRNLRMASNIRDMLATTPGIRALVIVGASHKGYLEAYLHQMHDMDVVDTGPLLR